MPEFRTTLIACCCACECEQFEAATLALSASVSTTYTTPEGGVSEWSTAWMFEVAYTIAFDPETAAACGQLLADSEAAPENCNYVTGDTGGCLLGSVDFSYPDPASPPADPADDWPSKTVALDLYLDYLDTAMDCEGNGTFSGALYVDGDAGDLAEVAAQGDKFAPSGSAISGVLTNWQGLAEDTYAQDETGEDGGGTRTITIEFLPVAP